MAFLDNTVLFKGIVEKHGDNREPNKSKKRKRMDDASLSRKHFIEEAQTILTHIHSLSQTLAGLRRPYLSFEENGETRAPRRMGFDVSSSDCSQVQRLTDEERDQIDIRTKTVISTCATRVRNLESLEKIRAQRHSGRSKPLRLLESLRAALGVPNASEECLAVHHNGITWFLNRRLAEVSLQQKELQEERIRLQSRRTHTLGNRAILEAAQMSVNNDRNTTTCPMNENDSVHSSLSSSWFSLNSSSENGWLSRSGVIPRDESPSITIFDDDARSGYQTQITPTQIQVFESENSELLTSMESELASVQRAETRLLEISALQSELVFHLLEQTEQTERLFDDAIASTSMAGKGNLQLREAARRAKDSRLFILVFLLGSSFALLFLHFY